MYILILLALTAGAVLPVQAALNAKLGRALGSGAPIATLASFVVGGLAVLLYLFVTRTEFPNAATVARVPPSLWIGGILGGLYVALVIWLTPKLGAAATMGFVVAGQIAMAVGLDHFGLLGLERHAISVPRLAGLALLVTGVILVKKF